MVLRTSLFFVHCEQLFHSRTGRELLEYTVIAVNCYGIRQFALEKERPLIHGAAEENMTKVSASVKSGHFNRLDGIVNVDGFQFFTIRKGALPDAKYIAGDVDSPQGVAVGKGAVINFDNACGQDHLFQCIAVQEAALADPKDGHIIDGFGDGQTAAAGIVILPELNGTVLEFKMAALGRGIREIIVTIFGEKEEADNAQTEHDRHNDYRRQMRTFLWGYENYRRMGKGISAAGTMDGGFLAGTAATLTKHINHLVGL